MKLRWLFFVVFISSLVVYFNYTTQRFQAAAPVETKQIYTHTVILLPLDSRPPCRQFVVDAGKIANIKVIVPPPNILDYYTQSGDTKALRLWLAENIKQADAAIISIDQLIHGGLLASREARSKESDEIEALDFLEKLHADNLKIPIYAFNILPRIYPTASIDNYKDQKALIKYSRLLDELATFENPLDLDELNQIQKKIKPEIIEKYKSLYTKNTLLNEKLSALAKQGVLTKLIIAQDDGQDFGIPNMEKRQIQRYLHQENIYSSQVTSTRGADEVALTLLSDINNKQESYQPKIYVEYCDEAAPKTIMPYMPCSVATTVKEKIALVNGQLVNNPVAADFILYVYIGNEKNLSQRIQSTKKIEGFLKQNYKVALVDLSKHFLAEETLFPILLNHNIPLNQLIAYAGWNTTSNAVGTAITQASLFTEKLRTPLSSANALLLYKNNLTFLNNRYVEDYYYLKEVIDLVNVNLKKSGFTNVNDLDLDHNYKWANDMLQTGLTKRTTLLKYSKAYKQSIPVHTTDGDLLLKINDIQIEASYPWPRTFEIYLEATLSLGKIDY
ncbi:Protein of unknown function [Propionispira arboris]|uniref:DUF4127 family protein n=1 Tax=Propionispira arboris TaxID=84035 RepID=A0A1H6VSC4_9FIRM|nr:DUF4127 family protein [Propionispira arboris]SEJ07568.1 Protein of unknown function [Propionispira arboris]